MKKLNVFLNGFLIIALACLFTQCTKDDNEPKMINSIKINGKDFPVISAAMMGLSIEDNGHTAIYLVSGSGTQANTLTIDVESFTKSTIEGDYKYPEENGKKILDGWLTNYAFFDGNNMKTSNLHSGEANISYHGGNNYTLTMNLKMADGTTFTGKYKGDFQVMFFNQ
jgi:hypothetical protein